MEATILVTTLNEHRNNKQAAGLMIDALLKLGYKVTTDINSEYSLAIVWNSLLTDPEKETLEFIAEKASILYMYVDNDLPFPPGYVTLVSQFYDKGDVYFPISKLAIFHKYWYKPIQKVKKYDVFYGGTYKSRRDYSVLSSAYGTKVITGDSKEWDKYLSTYDNSLPTIRDLDLLYNIGAMCSSTYIVYDPLHTGNNVPTRFYECVFMDMNCIVIDDKGNKTRFTPEEIKNSVSEAELLRQIKDLIERFIDGK